MTIQMKAKAFLFPAFSFQSDLHISLHQFLKKKLMGTS